jgi:hypothetical protein
MLKASPTLRSRPLEVPDDLSASAWQALMESVDYCPMGITICQTFGGKPMQSSGSAVDCGRYPPLEGPISHSGMALRRLTSVRWTVLWGTQWGQLDDLQVLS